MRTRPFRIAAAASGPFRGRAAPIRELFMILYQWRDSPTADDDTLVGGAAQAGKTVCPKRAQNVVPAEI
jgi:hypothetical protein